MSKKTRRNDGTFRKARTEARAVVPGSGTAEDLRVGDTIVVTVKRIGINGEGVGYYKRKAVFIDGAIPDEVVKAKVSRIEPGFIKASLLDIEKASRYRIKPACPVYETCGGCQLQHISYEGQLRAKEELVKEAFARYTGLSDIRIRPIAGMEHPWGYRNKAQLQVGTEQGRILTGLYSPGTHRLVDISGCPIQHPAVNRVIDAVKAIVEQLRIPVYDERKKIGSLRTIVARTGLESGEVQLTFITATDRLPQRQELVNAIRRNAPEVTSIAHNVNRRDTPLVFGEKTVIVWGKPHLEETLGSVSYSLSPRAFFQLNPEQTIKLYRYVAEAAALTGRELVVDAYCGTGTIALWLAPDAKEVRGIEAVQEAVDDARRNAERSGLDNVRFYAGKAETLLPKWADQGVRPDVIVVDPPRTGCDLKLLQTILRVQPKRFVYVSCNPSTLAKDCKVLLDGGFAIEWVQPVDMFPQTAHVECCSLLVRKDN